jgi:hypothetical protein
MRQTETQWNIPEELKRIGLIKFEILASGLRISDRAWRHMTGAKEPIRTRSGASGGLDLILPLNVYVNCPVAERFALQSQLVLDVEDGGLVIKREQQVLCTAKTQPTPRYYGLMTSDGMPMVKIGQMCSGDRFCYGMTGPYCFFWKSGNRCGFCSIGLNKDRDTARKITSQLLEVLAMAVEDPVLPAKHVLLGGGTPNVDDMGAVLAAELCAAIKERFSLSCYVMISAPSKNEFIDILWQAGVDELGMNIEFYSDDAWKQFIPGKAKHIGKKRYFEALEYAVSRFGPINTRSILVTGLEDPEHTIEGAESLASIGVMPILSPFRPLDDTELEHMRGFDHKTYFDIYVEAHSRSMRYGIPTGPTCIPCQNNTLALPLPGEIYRCY